MHYLHEGMQSDGYFSIPLTIQIYALYDTIIIFYIPVVASDFIAQKHEQKFSDNAHFNKNHTHVSTIV